MVRPIQGMLDLQRIQEGAIRVAFLKEGLDLLEKKFSGENIHGIEDSMRVAYEAFFRSMVSKGFSNSVPDYKIEFIYGTGQYTVFIEESWLEELLLPHRVLLRGFGLL